MGENDLRRECLEADHVISELKIKRENYLTQREIDKKWAESFSKSPFPLGPLENLGFYFQKNVIKYKYQLIMFNLEEKSPSFYQTLIKIGFPKPYTNSQFKRDASSLLAKKAMNEDN